MGIFIFRKASDEFPFFFFGIPYQDTGTIVFIDKFGTSRIWNPKPLPVTFLF